LAVLLQVGTLLPAAASAQVPPQARQLLFLETFNSMDAAALQSQRWLDAPHLKRLAGAGPDGSTALEVTYVPSPEGSERIAINLPLRRSVSRARLAFDVRFAPDFTFARGGKLLGLGPARPVTGGDPRRPDGWSARAMWREDGRLGTYLYEQFATRRFGIGQLSQQPVLVPGEWHHVTLDLQLNDPRQTNGLMSIRVDGRVVAMSDGLALRGDTGTATALIGQLLFHTFFGGADPSYQPRDAQGQLITLTALLDNLQVTSDEPIPGR
jgi:hypothetical protein